MGFLLQSPTCYLRPLNKSVLTDSEGGIQLGSNQEFGSINVRIEVTLFDTIVISKETAFWFIGKYYQHYGIIIILFNYY